MMRLPTAKNSDIILNILFSISLRKYRMGAEVSNFNIFKIIQCSDFTDNSHDSLNFPDNSVIL